MHNTSGSKRVERDDEVNTLNWSKQTKRAKSNVEPHSERDGDSFCERDGKRAGWVEPRKF